MTDNSNAPERIWGETQSGWGDLLRGRWQSSDAMGGIDVRADLFDAMAQQLADARTERDARVAGAVKVKPLVWGADDDDPDCLTAGDYDIYHEGHGYQAYFWSVMMGEPHPTLASAKAFVWQHHDARILAAIQPCQDVQALIAAAYEAAAGALESVAENWDCGHNESRLCDCARGVEQWGYAADEVRTLTHADAKAAQARRDAQMMAKGMRDASQAFVGCDGERRNILARADEIEKDA